MIDVFINGERRRVDPQTSVATLLMANEFDCARVAVAINSTFVARANYATHLLAAGDQIDVVAPMAGG